MLFAAPMLSTELNFAELGDLSIPDIASLHAFSAWYPGLSRNVGGSFFSPEKANTRISATSTAGKVMHPILDVYLLVSGS